MSAELRERAATLAAQTKAYAKELDRARKALESLAEEAGWRDRAQRVRSLKALEEVAARPRPDFGAFLAPVAQAVAEFARALRQGFLDRFVAAIDAAQLRWRELGQQPPVLDVAGVQVSLDFEKEEAELSYAREPLARAPLDPAAVLGERHAQIERLAMAWPGAAAFFDACDAAYRARVAREGRPFGERVHLVDLLPELAVEYERRGFLSKGGRPCGRAELAWCLDRLAREGALEQGGRRLELGTATGGSTKDKRQVLFLEAGMGGGQYYLSARVVPVAAAGERR